MLPHRKQLRHFEISNQPRFLTFSCYQRLPLFQSDRIKDAFVVRVAAARQQQGFRLLGWVIMPEHIHLILVPRLPRRTDPKGALGLEATLCGTGNPALARAGRSDSGAAACC